MSGQKLATIQPIRKEAAQVINEFQSDTVEIDTRPEPLAARFTLWALALLMIFAISWASFATLDRIVNARGKVVSTASNVVLLAFEGGTIRSVEARAGDIVKAGQPLAHLDPTFTKADVDQLLAKIASLDATISRLEAEKLDRPFVRSEQDRFGYWELQEAIWKERRTQYSSQMRLYAEKIARAETNIAAQENEFAHLSSRLKILREVEDMRQQLEEAKTGSRLNSLLARDARVDVERNLARARNTIQENRHEMEALLAERDVYTRQWEAKIIEDLVARRNERDGFLEQLTKANRRQEMGTIISPVDAVVLEAVSRSVGSLVKAGEAMFRLVPLNEPLEVEAMIDARQLGYVAVGDAVQIKLDAYPYGEHGMLEGVVEVISSDSFSDSRNSRDAPDTSFYKARVSLRKTELNNVPDTFRLIPGMPLNAEIKVGTRSVIAYFMRPFLRGMNEPMREP